MGRNAGLGVITLADKKTGEAIAGSILEDAGLRCFGLACLEAQITVDLVLCERRVLLVAIVNAEFEAVSALLPADRVVDSNAVVNVVAQLVTAKGDVPTDIDTGKACDEWGAQLRVVVDTRRRLDRPIDGVRPIEPKIEVVQDVW